MLIVEELALLREGVAAVLEREGCVVVGRAQITREAHDALAYDAPQLVVVGRLLDAHIAHLITTMKTPFPAPLVIVLVDTAGAAMVPDLLAAGADGVIRRSASVEELTTALGVVLDGGRHIAPSLLPSLAGSVAPDIDLTTGSGEAAMLSVREREMLVFLAQGKTNREIADELCISVPTVKSHLARVYNKLGVNCRADALGAAVNLGLLV